MRRLLTLTFVAAFFVCASAQASTMTYNIDFHTFTTPVIAGSYTLTFDPTQDYGDTSKGLIVNSVTGFTAPTPANTGFTYSASGGGTLYIGGLIYGISLAYAGTPDYFVGITNFQTAPTFSSFAGPSFFLFANSGTATVTPVSAAAVTPEPSSLALLGTGALGAIGIVRRRA